VVIKVSEDWGDLTVVSVAWCRSQSSGEIECSGFFGNFIWFVADGRASDHSVEYERYINLMFLRDVVRCSVLLSPSVTGSSFKCLRCDMLTHGFAVACNV
jgi:hypothetical protein